MQGEGTGGPPPVGMSPTAAAHRGSPTAGIGAACLQDAGICTPRAAGSHPDIHMVHGARPAAVPARAVSRPGGACVQPSNPLGVHARLGMRRASSAGRPAVGAQARAVADDTGADDSTCASSRHATWRQAHRLLLHPTVSPQTSLSSDPAATPLQVLLHCPCVQVQSQSSCGPGARRPCPSMSTM